MFRIKLLPIALVFLLSGLLLPTSKDSAFALTCQHVRQLTTVYLKLHYSFNNFDDELSSRTLDFFIKSWDSGKLYFYDSDVEMFKKKYDKKLDDMVMSANCNAINEVINVYGKRFDERQKEIAKLIEMKHKFNVDEYMEIDRKKIEYASNSKELNERWRKRIKFQMLNLKKTINNMNKVRDKIRKRYKLMAKRHNEQTLDQVYARFLNSFSSSLDPHSDYMSPDQLEEFRIQTRLSLEGIGAVLRSEDGFTVVQSIVPGGAAFKGGKLKVEDKIIAVAQESGTPVDVIDMDLRDVVKLIRGAGGTKVRLTVVREKKGKSKQIVIPIIREKIQLTDRTAKSKVIKVSVKEGKKTIPMKVGLLNLPSFYVDFEGQHSKRKNYRSSANDMRREIENLSKAKVDAIVLDLRTNGGGSLTESIKIAGLFFDKGPVVQIKESDGNVYPHADKDGKTFYKGPLVVLTSRQSASATEILAGAIQDYQRGLIVGDDHTFGKGTVQNLNDIGAKLGATKITISKFYRPSGSSTQLNGVGSDIIFPSLLNEIEIGEKHYDYALAWDVIKKTPYQQFNLVKPYIKTIKKQSAARIKKDAYFKEIISDIKEWKKNEKERSRVSLNEDADKDKKDDDDDDDDDDKKSLVDEDDLSIDEDAHAQESIRIAADYARLLSKKKLGLVTINGLKKKPKKVQVADVKKKTKGAQKKDVPKKTN